MFFYMLAAQGSRECCYPGAIGAWLCINDARALRLVVGEEGQSYTLTPGDKTRRAPAQPGLKRCGTPKRIDRGAYCLETVGLHFDPRV
jgi:hypothetical protein